MKRTSLSVLLILFLVCWVFSAPSRATTVLDTGYTSAGNYLDPYNYDAIAAEFTITQPMTITDIRSYLNPGGTFSLDISIHNDGGDVPGSLYNGYSRTENGLTDIGMAWYGATGLNWLLIPNTYWAVIEVTNITAGTTLAYLASSAAANNAFHYHYGSWTQSTSTERYYSWLINGTPVPEPATMFLLGLGLLGLAGVRRSKK